MHGDNNITATTAARAAAGATACRAVQRTTRDQRHSLSMVRRGPPHVMTGSSMREPFVKNAMLACAPASAAATTSRTAKCRMPA
jgi:hypothetical protein